MITDVKKWSECVWHQKRWRRGNIAWCSEFLVGKSKTICVAFNMRIYDENFIEDYENVAWKWVESLSNTRMSRSGRQPPIVCYTKNTSAHKSDANTKMMQKWTTENERESKNAGINGTKAAQVPIERGFIQSALINYFSHSGCANTAGFDWTGNYFILLGENARLRLPVLIEYFCDSLHFSVLCWFCSNAERHVVGSGVVAVVVAAAARWCWSYCRRARLLRTFVTAHS